MSKIGRKVSLQYQKKVDEGWLPFDMTPSAKGKDERGKDNETIRSSRKKEAKTSKNKGKNSDTNINPADDKGSQLPLRICAQECCGRRESEPREFPVCQGCRRDSKKYEKKFLRSYYCGEDCYEIDWLQRHGQFHKNLRKQWEKEMEELLKRGRPNEGSLGQAARGQQAKNLITQVLCAKGQGARGQQTKEKRQRAPDQSAKGRGAKGKSGRSQRAHDQGAAAEDTQGEGAGAHGTDESPLSSVFGHCDPFDPIYDVD